MRFVAVTLAAAMMMLGACASEPPQSNLATGIAALKSGDFAVAEASFGKVLAKDPNDAFGNLNMGVVKASTGRRDEAIQHYRLAAANGQSVPAVEILTPGAGGSPFNGSVADLANRNLEALGV